MKIFSLCRLGDWGAGHRTQGGWLQPCSRISRTRLPSPFFSKFLASATSPPSCDLTVPSSTTVKIIATSSSPFSSAERGFSIVVPASDLRFSKLGNRKEVGLAVLLTRSFPRGPKVAYSVLTTHDPRCSIGGPANHQISIVCDRDPAS